MQIADRQNTALTELANWLKQNRPLTANLLEGKQMHQVRYILNTITGCDVRGTDTIEQGCKVWLEKLKAQDLVIR